MRLFTFDLGINGQCLAITQRDDEEGPFTVELTSDISGYRVVGVTRRELESLWIELRNSLDFGDLA